MREAFSDRCGSNAPGNAATPSNDSNTNAVRIEVSPRHVFRTNAKYARESASWAP
ncbi:hypothetical protein GCM10023321_28890 [Pseudonocardia eucalypti]|uniref:Uncharacterized protein n=1 Tax=Pseudonocardia eucalypti TaxID=648755 RepID=A0ABP9Q194_9PSEU